MIHLDEKDESNSSGQPIAAAESLAHSPMDSLTADETGDAEEPEFELGSAESEDEAEIQMEEKDFAGEAPELVYNWLSSNKDDASIWQHRRAYQSLRQRVHELMDEDRQVKLRAFMALDDAEESEFVYEPAEILKELRRLSKQFGDALNRIRKQTENDLNANLLAKKDVLDEMRQVITDESDIKKAIQKFRTLLKRWKEIGSIPSREADVVYNNYRHFYVM